MRALILVGLMALIPVLTPAASAQPTPPTPPQPPAEPGWLGISFNASDDDGALEVEEVAEGAPAEEAGIRPGDRIVRWNGRLDVMSALRADRPAPGDTVHLRVAREGQRDFDVSVVAGRPGRFVERRIGPNREEIIVVRPGRIMDHLGIHGDSIAAHVDSIHSEIRVMLRDSLGPRLERVREQLGNTRIEIRRETEEIERAIRSGLGVTLAGGRNGFAGAEMADVTEGLGSYFGTETGALVLRVVEDTPAADSGLREGDVIVSANGSEIEDVRDLMETVGRAQRERARDTDDADRSVRLEVMRRGNRVGLTLER